MTIQGRKVFVDIRAEIEPFMDRFHNVREHEDKISMSSPFRFDRDPSFVLFLDRGIWVDLGVTETGMDKGPFTVLLAHLHGTDVPAIERYLLKKYLAFDTDGVKLDLRLRMGNDYLTIDPAMLDTLQPSKYLAGRGIGYDTQRRFMAGENAFTGRVYLPYFDTAGRLVNVKMRSITEKVFRCLDEGQPVNNHLFGWAQSANQSDLYVTEAEIDAMYLTGCGFPAVALGTAHMSDAQKALLIRHSAGVIVAATDNDKAGEKCARQLAKALSGYKIVRRAFYPDGAKDVNEIRPLTQLLTRPYPILENVEAPK